MAQDEKFEWFPIDTPDPCGKFKQPIKCSTEGVGSGYPETDVEQVKTPARGKGAATKGYFFDLDD